MRLIEIYKCLCDQTRLRILNLLSQGPLCVCHFQEVLKLDQVPVSKSLAYLRKHRIVITQRHGQWVIYSLPGNPADELHVQLRCLRECVQTNAVFREDLKRLKTLRSNCSWVADVAEIGSKGKRK